MWDDVKWFVAAADSGSFSRAAERQGVSIATISRRVNALEQQLGIRLLDRQVSGVTLTVEGQLVFEVATVAADKMAEVQRLSASLRESVDIAPVVVSSTEPIISEILAPNLADFWRNNPAIKLRLSVDTANISLSRREADIAIRLARPTQDNVVIKRLPTIRQGLFASTDYLKGKNIKNMDLNDETFLGMDRSFGDIPESMWMVKQGLAHRQVLESSSVRTLCNAARENCGIAFIPAFIARLENLVEIPGFVMPKRSPYLVFHQDFRKVKRVKSVRDWVVACFEKVLK